MGKKTDALVIFAKYPEPGKVKTRLAADIGADRAAGLYRDFLYLTLQNATRISNADLFLAYDPPGKRQAFFKILDQQVRLMAQAGGDLGHRMATAFEQLLSDHRKVVLLGTDSPTLPNVYLRQAFSALSASDAVIGPTEDGGYYLIGLRAPQPELFQGVPWSTGDVLDETLKRAGKLGLQVHLLPPWHDIDTLADLRKALLYDQGPLREIVRKHDLEAACMTCVPTSSSRP